MRHALLADRADRILARLFPTRFRASAREGRHGRVGAPHLWRMQRAFQIDFLQRMGLDRQHHLLDLGCGTLRGGLPLIAYLSAGNYTGIDVRAEDGTLVRAVREGIVSSPAASGAFGTLNEWLRTGPLAYVHVRVGRTRRDEPLDAARAPSARARFVPTFDEAGKLVRMRVRRGARFATGDVVGTVNRFNHVHLNVGWPGEEVNPLGFRLVQFADTVAPTIARRGIRLFDETGQPLERRERGRLLVSGRVQIVVDAWDQADGNRPGRRLGLYSLGYQVLARDRSPMPGFETPLETIRFDRFAADADGPRRVYASGSGIPFYARRVTRFLYIVSNTLRDGVAAEGFWDTTALPPGDYTLRIHAADVQGNTAAANRDLPVTVVPAAVSPASLRDEGPAGATKVCRSVDRSRRTRENTRKTRGHGLARAL
jgi:hypothetical protein